MKNLFLSGILIFLGVRCSSTDNTVVNIRIKNVSQENFENLSVLNFSLDNLSPGQATEFRKFEKAYRVASVYLEIDGKEYSLQLIDLVGESPLPIGNYTYEIGLNQNEESLSFNLVKE